MSALKCPNPSCPYLFDPSGVPAGVVLTCPRCGMRFTLGPPPGGRAPAPQPAANLDFGAPDGEIARAPTRRDARAVGGSGTRTTIALVVVSLALLAGVGATVYFRMFHTPARSDRDDGAAELREYNLTFEPPGPGWVRDDDRRARLGPPYLLLYRKGDATQPGDADPCWALGARDYSTREPRPVEVRDGLIQPLTALFADLSVQDVDGASWLGRPATAITFHGRQKRDGSKVVGQGYAAGHKGFGYWAVGWAAEADAAAAFPEFDALREKARLLGTRDGWSPKEAAARAFAGRKLRYEVVDRDGVWAEPDPDDRKPADVDPDADLLLVAREKRKGRDFVDEATFVVLVVDGAGGDDPLAAGRKVVDDKRAAEVKEAGGKPAFTDLPPDGAAPGVVRFRSLVSDGRGQSRLHVVAAVPVGDKLAVAHGWCPWADRLSFEDRLIRLASSLRERK